MKPSSTHQVELDAVPKSKGHLEASTPTHVPEGPHHEEHKTLSPAERKWLWKHHHAKHDAPLQIENQDWVWVPCVVILLFVVALLLTRKCRCLNGKSLRFKLTEYVSVEPLVNTMRKVDHHHHEEQKKIEIGHLVFSLIGVAFLVTNYILYSDEYRWLFFIPSAIQICLMFISCCIDFYYIRYGAEEGIRSIRSVNTKLRFGHSTYQVILFCVDFLHAGFVQLPVDCYIWATVHYAYEAVGLLLEGLNVIGLSELVIIVLVNANAMVNNGSANVNSTGPLAAFGITCILLSCASLIVVIPFKFFDVRRLRKEKMRTAHSDLTDDLLTMEETSNRSLTTFAVNVGGGGGASEGDEGLMGAGARSGTRMSSSNLKRPLPPPPPEPNQGPLSSASTASSQAFATDGDLAVLGEGSSSSPPRLGDRSASTGTVGPPRPGRGTIAKKGGSAASPPPRQPLSSGASAVDIADLDSPRSSGRLVEMITDD